MLRRFLPILLLLCAVACGQSGPLYRPGQEPPHKQSKFAVPHPAADAGATKAPAPASTPSAECNKASTAEKPPEGCTPPAPAAEPSTPPPATDP